MKSVFDYIADKSSKFAEEPWFVFLRNPDVGADEKLQIVPWAAHFVMTFGDLYRFFLRSENPRDRYDELANVHLSEESTHSKWYLLDLPNMGMDPTMPFSEALRLIWGDSTLKIRRLAYEICKLSAGLGSLERLVFVSAIEATGRVTLDALIPVGLDMEKRRGRRLIYFGNHHLDSEHHHTVEDAGVRSMLERVELDESVRAGMFSIVDRVFLHFTGFTDDAFRIAQSGARLIDSGNRVERERTSA